MTGKKPGVNGRNPTLVSKTVLSVKPGAINKAFEKFHEAPSRYSQVITRVVFMCCSYDNLTLFKRKNILVAWRHYNGPVFCI